MTDEHVTIPRAVVDRALWKARIEYERVAARDGQDAGPPSECWAEFEALADAVKEANE